MYAVVQVPGALATMLPVPTFADAVADAVAGGVGGGAVGAREGVCDLGGFVVGDDQRLWSESALKVATLACALQWRWKGGSAYIMILRRCMLTISEKLHRPLLHLLV